MKKIIFIISFAAFFFVTYSSFAQLQVTANNNAAQLAGTLAGNGVTITNATMNCPSNVIPKNNPTGTFVGTSSNIGIAGGILLTSGDIKYAVGPNALSSSGADNQVTFNDPDLMAIDPNAIYDVCLLEFDAKPTCDTLKFTFAFGSDEYPEFVANPPSVGYNDAFGIFVTGPNPSGPAYAGFNVAKVPATATPVSINNVNNGYTFGCPTTGPCNNCAYYVDNCATGPPTTVEYDGFTKPITVKLSVIPCGSYHFKLGIADAVDHIYDSGVFFALQSLVCATSLTVTATSTNTNCSGTNGTATVTSVAGGNAPYTYVWSNGQSTSSVSGLTAGSYSVTAIDANGCLSGSQTVSITNAGGGFTVTPAQSNVTCFGNNNGSASVTNPTGGTPPYSYAWSTAPVQTTPTVSNIPAGNYTCSITDAAGCTKTMTFTITQPAALTATVTNSTNVSCPAPSPGNGTATASASGGTGTLNYSWNSSPAQSGPNASNLIAGNYIVTVTDANSCTKTASVTITAPPSMTVTASSTPSPCGVTSGTASASSSGGSTPYTFLWLTNPVQTTPTAIGLAGGMTYTVIVTDAKGCTQLQSVAVGGGVPPIADFLYIPSDVISMLDPIVAFTDASTGNPTTWSWNFGDPNSGANNISSLQTPTHIYSDTGIYCISLVISDAAGFCKDSIVKCLKVESPFTFYIPNAFTPNSDGFNELFMGYGTYIKEFEIKIFDRWGNEIFKSNDLTKGWNGKVKNKGQLVQEDVYVWKVELTDLHDKKHKYIGHVTIVK